MLSPADHAIVLLITIALPAHDLFFWYPRLLRGHAAHAPHIRVRSYVETMLVEWALVAITLAYWWRRERSWDDLGLGLSLGLGFWTGLVFTAGVIVFITWQRISLLQDPEAREEIVDHLRGLRPLLPHTPREMRSFSAVSVTAGICEEILFRGFLIWYLALLVPFPAAVIVGALLFGMAHAYQGTRGIGQTALVGLGLAVLYVVTGSLWLPMILHAFIDWNSGLLAYAVLGPGRFAPPPQGPREGGYFRGGSDEDSDEEDPR